MASVSYIPQTPSLHRYTNQKDIHSPHTSSPLASSHVFNMAGSPSFRQMEPPSSPLMSAHSRRQSQFKSRQSTHASNSSCFSPSGPSSTVPPSSRQRRSSRYTKPIPSAPIPFKLSPSSSLPNSNENGVESSQTAWLREKFKQSCFEKARRARERKINKGRGRASEPSSDGFDVDMDEGEDGEGIDAEGFDDEIFKRIVANERRKQLHAFALSYELEVGSSFDPSFEEFLDSENERQTVQESEEQPPEEFMFDDDIDFDPDEYEAGSEAREDDDGSWMDAYIANLPSDALEESFDTVTNMDSTLPQMPTTPLAPTTTASQGQNQQSQQYHLQQQRDQDDSQMDDVMMG